MMVIAMLMIGYLISYKQTKIPYLAVAGNHDVTNEIGIHLAHQERIHVPILPDRRLKIAFGILFKQGMIGKFYY